MNPKDQSAINEIKGIIDSYASKVSAWGEGEDL